MNYYITNSPQGVKATHKHIPFANDNQQQIFDHALKTYSFILPYNVKYSGPQWIEAIKQTYEGARAQMICKAIETYMPN